jgi:transcriptional regulator with XRE-family HTH domain
MCYNRHMKEIKDIFSDNLIYLRKSKGYTQITLAEALSYSDKAISKWERKEALPDIVTLKKIADLFGITVDRLITDEDFTSVIEADILPKEVIKGFKIKLALLTTSAIWLVAVIVFVILSLAAPELKTWLTFIITLPITFLTHTIFSMIAKSKIFTLISFTLLSTTVALLLFILIDVNNSWLFFIIPIPTFFVLLFSLSLSK